MINRPFLLGNIPSKAFLINKTEGKIDRTKGTANGPNTSGTMRDLISPKRRDVFLRLRRRIDLYRQHQGECYSRYQPLSSGIYELQQQETLLLHQKWLENKSKRSTKHSKGKECQTQDQKNTNISGIAVRAKRKIEDASIAAKNIPGELGKKKYSRNEETFNDYTSIIQESTSYSDSSRKTHQSIISGHPLISTLSGKKIDANKQDLCKNYATCKREPADTVRCVSSSGSSQTSFPDIDDVDELQAILESLTEDGEEISVDLIKELDNGLKEVQPPACSGADSTSHCCKTEHIEGKAMVCPSSMFSESSYEKSGKFSPLGSAVLSDYHLVNAGDNARTVTVTSQSGLLGDTGPAAETLKQMAAQHRCHYNGNYDVKCNINHNLNHNVYNCRHPRDSQNIELFECGVQNDYGGGTLQAYRYSDSCKGNAITNEKEVSYNYDTTKPLSHLEDHLPVFPYKDCHSSTFSLQHLQNRVHSQFNQGQSTVHDSEFFKDQQIQHSGNRNIGRICMDGPLSPTNNMMPIVSFTGVRQQQMCIQDPGINITSIVEKDANVRAHGHAVLLQCKDTEFKLNACASQSRLLKNHLGATTGHTMENLTNATDLNLTAPVDLMDVSISQMEGTVPTSDSTCIAKQLIAFPVISSSQDNNGCSRLLSAQQTNAPITHAVSSSYTTSLMAEEKPQNASNVISSSSQDTWPTLYENLSSPHQVFPNITLHSDVQAGIPNNFNGHLSARPLEELNEKPLNSMMHASFQDKLCTSTSHKFSVAQHNTLVTIEQSSSSSLMPALSSTQFMKAQIKMPAMQPLAAHLTNTTGVEIQNNRGNYMIGSCFRNGTISHPTANYNNTGSGENDYIIENLMNSK